MKKILAVVMTLILALGLSVTAFAAVSPSGSTSHQVTVKQGQSGTSDPHTVTNGDDITVKSDPSKGTFDDWSIYKPDGTPAKEGVDYEIVEGTTKDSSMTVKPLTDIIICGNYNGETTSPSASGTASTSPATGDFSALYLALIMLGALGTGVVAKKQLAR